MQSLLTANTLAITPTMVSVIYSLVLTLALGIVIAFTYVETFQGLSYSRNYVQSLILGSLVVAIAMQAIGDNLARGLGMMGALALIRFRSTLRDPRDMMFIFCTLALGIAAGVHAYMTAIIGTIAFSLCAFMLHNSPFGQQTYFDGVLRFSSGVGENIKQAIDEVFSSYCRRYTLITLREVAQGDRIEYAYQVKLKNKDHAAQMLESLQKTAGIKGVNFLLQESTLEL